MTILQVQASPVQPQRGDLLCLVSPGPKPKYWVVVLEKNGALHLYRGERTYSGVGGPYANLSPFLVELETDGGGKPLGLRALRKGAEFVSCEPYTRDS